jgi:hypothetical protein
VVLSTATTIQAGTGISSPEKFGVLSAGTSASIAPQAVTSQEAFGTAQVIPGSISISVTAIPGQEIVQPVAGASVGLATINPQGIISEERTGTSSLTAVVAIQVLGVPSDSSLGTNNVTNNIGTLPGFVPTGEQFGSPSVVAGYSVLPQGFGKEEGVGSLTAGGSVSPQGFVEEAIGSPTVVNLPAQGINIAGLKSEEIVGQATISRVVFVSSIGSADAQGSPSVTGGAVIIRAAGISTSEIVNSSLTQLAERFVQVQVNDPFVSTTVQDPILSYEVDAKVLWEVSL